MRVESVYDEIWVNDRYQVYLLYDNAEHSRAGFCQLSIKTHDREAEHDWREYQWIKNDVMGPEREAVEVYPAESRLVDGANQFHLWVLPEGDRIPFGFSVRLVSDAIENDPDGVKQRPFPPNRIPTGQPTRQQRRANSRQIAKLRRGMRLHIDRPVPPRS